MCLHLLRHSSPPVRQISRISTAIIVSLQKNNYNKTTLILVALSLLSSRIYSLSDHLERIMSTIIKFHIHLVVHAG